MSGGNTPEEKYQRALRGIAEGDPAVLGATEPPAIGPGAGYEQDDLARDLGIEPGDRALPRAVSAYAGAFTDAFWQETERAARTTPARTRHGLNHEARRKAAPGKKKSRAGKEYGNTEMRRGDKPREVFAGGSR